MTTSETAKLAATIVITSKDRCADLRKALLSCVTQAGGPEIIVVDDASTDDTALIVREEFPGVNLITHAKPMGYIMGRNEAALVATGDVIFSIDDDAIFTTPNVVQQTLAQFDDARIGAAAIPFADVNKSPRIHQKAPGGDDCWVADRYIGTAHAVRRDVFLKLGGYRECYFHQGEERDFCLRMLNSGFVVRLGISDPIHHFESPKRDTTRMDLYGRRNDVLYVWLNIPATHLAIALPATTLRGLWFGVKVGRPFRMLRGVFMGYVAVFNYWAQRAPVRSQTGRLFRTLQRMGPIRLEEVESRLFHEAGRGMPRDEV